MKQPTNIQKKLLKHQIVRLQSEMTHYKKNKKYRYFFFFLYLFALPVFIPTHLTLMLLQSLSKQKYTNAIRFYLKLYFKGFFFFSGVETLPIFPITKLEKPSLIFALRSTPMISPYLLTQFEEPINLPYQSILSKFPLNLFFPFLRLGPFVESLGHPDKPLKNCITHIESTLKNNKSIVVYINHGISNHRHESLLHLHKSFYELLKLPIDCYFIRCKNLELYNIGDPLHPQLINLSFHSKEDLFDGVKDSIEEYALRIRDFYDFNIVKATD
jgi:hypothetical protein